MKLWAKTLIVVTMYLLIIAACVLIIQANEASGLYIASDIEKKETAVSKSLLITWDIPAKEMLEQNKIMGYRIELMGPNGDTVDIWDASTTEYIFLDIDNGKHCFKVLVIGNLGYSVLSSPIRCVTIQ